MGFFFFGKVSSVMANIDDQEREVSLIAINQVGSSVLYLQTRATARRVF